MKRLLSTQKTINCIEVYKTINTLNPLFMYKTFEQVEHKERPLRLKLKSKFTNTKY